MTCHHHFPQTDLLLVMPTDLTLSAIAKELDVLKRKLEYATKNPDFIGDRQELGYYLNTLVHDLNIINRGLPPLPQEMEIFDTDGQ
jgi:hypothetical protein